MPAGSQALPWFTEGVIEDFQKDSISYSMV
jgi:hypothetical protein